MAHLSPVAEEAISQTPTPGQVRRGRGRPRKSTVQAPVSSSPAPPLPPQMTSADGQHSQPAGHTPLPSSSAPPPSPKVIGIDGGKEDALFPDLGSGEKPSVNYIRMRIMQRMRDIDDKRYIWAPKIIEKFSRRILQDWKTWKDERDQLEDEVNMGMRELGAAGFAKEVDDLASFLLASPRVSQPGRWEIPFFVPGSKGRQMLIFKGPADGEERNTTQAPAADPGAPDEVQPSAPALGDIPEADIARFLSLSDNAGVDLNNAAVSVPLTHARVEQYIFTTGSKAFCIHCPCPRVVMPALRLDPTAPTHELLPPHLDITNSLDHFQHQHREHFSSVEQLLSKYGQIITDKKLNKWDIAAHNTSIRMRHRHAAIDWARTLETTESGPTAQGGAVAPLRRSVDAGALPADAAVFPWPEPGGDLIVLICPCPTCYFGAFTSQALQQRNQALDHFLRHGLDLANEEHMIQLFGFKVVGDLRNTKFRSTSVGRIETPAPAPAPALQRCLRCLVRRKNDGWDLNNPVVKREKELAARRRDLKRKRDRKARSSSLTPRPLARAQSLDRGSPARDEESRTLRSSSLAPAASQGQERRPFTRAQSMVLQSSSRSYHHAPGASLRRRSGRETLDQLAL